MDTLFGGQTAGTQYSELAEHRGGNMKILCSLIMMVSLSFCASKSWKEIKEIPAVVDEELADEVKKAKKKLKEKL